MKEGVCVEKNKTIANIKKNIEDHLGEKVILKANGGRNFRKQRTNRNLSLL